MTQDRRVRPDSPNASPAMEDMVSGPLSVEASSIDLANVAQIARTLEAHGGGAASADLALDLVLHDFVEQAQDATRADGAAAALIRDDEMVCRATTGQSAPDLGVRVESSSGLVGLCVSTGTVQHCKDTESDSRVNPEVCRQLGVRSMLIAPLMDAGRVVGVLQVFSDLPHAFGDRDVDVLQQFATAIGQSIRELRQNDEVPVRDQITEIDFGAGEGSTPARIENSEPLDTDKSRPDAPREIWSYVLFVLVIAAAILLGLLVGWHGGRKELAVAPVVQPTAAQPAGNSDNSEPRSATTSVPSTNRTPSQAKLAPPISVPDGGLLVTQNGRVIYRSVPEQSKAAPDSSTRRAVPTLLHRVEPEYPEAARAQHIQGPVVLDVQVLPNGDVGNVNVISGAPVLASAAVSAVKQWRYQPTGSSEKNVERRTRLTIRFVLPGS